MAEIEELNALLRVIPQTAAAQLKIWKLQKDVFTEGHPAVAAPFAVAAALANKITVEPFWWGFHFVIPEPVMAQWIAGGVTVTGFIASIAGVAGPAAPFVALAGAYVTAELALMKTVDKGKGVYLSMSWFAPGIFVPTSI